MAGSGGQGDDAEGPDDGLTTRQAKAVEALLQEPTVTRAAAVAGANERTLRRWMQLPVFRDALLRGRREAFAQAIGLTQKYAALAVAALVKVMQDAASPPSSRVTAAAVLLKFGREGIELDDLAERVEMLERSARGEPQMLARNNGNGHNGKHRMEPDEEDEA
jgi:hypothetical protein